MIIADVIMIEHSTIMLGVSVSVCALLKRAIERGQRVDGWVVVVECA